MSRNDQHPTCRNMYVETKESQSNIVSKNFTNLRNSRRKYNIQNDIKITKIAKGQV